MAEGKKIVFDGVDNGFFSMLDKGKAKGVDMYNTLVKKAQELNTTTKDQIKYVEESIKAFERETKILGTYKEHLKEIQILKERLYRTKHAGEQYYPLASYTQGNNVQKQVAEQAIDLQKAKTLISKIASEGTSGARQNFIGQLTDRYFTDEGSLNPKQISKFAHVLKSSDSKINVDSLSSKLNEAVSSSTTTVEDGMRKASSLDEKTSIHNLQQRTNELLRENIDTSKDIHEEATAEDKKNTEKQIEEEKKSSNGGKTPEQILNEDVIKEKSKAPEKEKTVFGEVLKANLLTELIKGAFHGIGKAFEKTKDFGSNLVTAETGETMLADTISESIPLFGPLIGRGLARRNKEQFKVEQAESRLAGLTGRFDKGFSNDRSITDQERFGGIYAAVDYGYDMGETLQAREQFARAFHSRRSQGDVMGALAAEKNFTLDRGTITSEFSKQALSKGNISPLENIAQVFERIPSLKLDSTDLENVLKLQTQVIEQNSTLIEKANRGEVTDMISRFKSIDSEFFTNTHRLAPIVSSINQSLQSPQNDFSKARSFKVLSEMNPGASYFDLIEKQSRGISEKNFLQKTLEEQSKMTGGGENLMTSLTGRQFGGGGILNLAPEVARALVTSFEKNPTLFKDWGGTEDEILDKAAMSKRAGMIKGGAEGKVTVREKEMVEAGDAFVFGVSSGMKEVASQMGHEFVAELKKLDLKDIPWVGSAAEKMKDLLMHSLEEMMKKSPHKANNGVHGAH